MTSIFTGIKNFIKTNFITQITGVMVKGSLGQKVAVLLGLLIFLFGAYMAIKWILLIIGGYIIVYLGFKDYERMRKPSDT
jgi:hypothetical protein